MTTVHEETSMSSCLLEGPRTVGLLDILGTSAILRGGRVDRAQKLKAALGSLYGFRADLRNSHGFPSRWSERGLREYGFSDHLAVTGPATANGFLDVAEALHSAYGRLMREHGLASRGGVCVGDMFEIDTVVGGIGLVRAHELERNAKFPRIVLDWQGLSGEYRERLRKRWFRPHVVRQSADAPIWIHPVKSLPFGVVSDEWRPCVRTSCSHALGETVAEDKHATKWQWLRDRCDDE